MRHHHLYVLSGLLLCAACSDTALLLRAPDPIPVGCPPLGYHYNRDSLFGNWGDVDRDCQNTRAEILIARSRGAVTFTRSAGCTVDSGQWLDLYTGAVVVAASELQIDHVVPVHEAWVSGAWAWNRAQRVEFANDTANLLAVSSSANLAKSDRRPDEWLPPDSASWPAYVAKWVAIKRKYGLPATARENRILSNFHDSLPSTPTECY